MFISGLYYFDLVIKINAEIVTVVDWIKINKLSPNLEETHLMSVRKPRQLLNLENELSIDKMKIEVNTHNPFLRINWSTSDIWRAM